MKKSSERRALADYYSQRNTVAPVGDWQSSRPRFTPFHRENRMKPSRVTSQPSHPRPKTILPRSSPERRFRPGPQRPPRHFSGSFRPLGFVPRQLNNAGSFVSRPHYMSKDKLVPRQYSVQPPRIIASGPNLFQTSASRPHLMSGDKERPRQSPIQTSSRQFSPLNAASAVPMTQSLPSLFHPATPPHGRNSKNLSPARHFRRDQVPQSKSAVSNSGTVNDSTHRQQPDQKHPHEGTISSQKLNPVMDLNWTSHKRQLESASCYVNVKKLRLESATETAKPPADKSPRTPLVSQPSSKHTSFLEQSPNARGGTPETDTSEQSQCPEHLSTVNPVQSHDNSQLPKPCTRTLSPMGVKQAILHSTQNDTVMIKSPSCPKLSELIVKKRSEVNDKKDKSGSLSGSPHLPRRDSSSSSHANSDNHHSSPTTTGSTVKFPGKGNQIVERRKSDGSTPKQTSKPKSVISGSRTVERNKSSRARRAVVIPDDGAELFTPDPLTYVVSPQRKMAKKEGEKLKSPTSEKDCSSRVTFSSRSPVTESPPHKTQNITPATVSSHVSSLTGTLKRVHLEHTSPTHTKLKKSPSALPDVQAKDKRDKSDDKRTPPPSMNSISHKVLHAAASQHTATPSGSQRPPLERQDSGVSKKQVKEDPVAMDLDLDLSLELDFEVTQSSQRSEEDDQLVTLQEMMEHASKPPNTPEKGAFSEPSTPGYRSPPVKKLLQSTVRSGTYRNNLDQILKEINSNKRAKETEMQILDACKEDLLRIAEYEEAEENREEAVDAEQQEFLQRYSLMSSAFKEVPPGEEVFNLEKFGQIFDQDTLQLRQYMVKPHGTMQKTLLWSSPAQLRLHVTIGLFQEAYEDTPCPTQVTCFLFKMMSIHSERLLSDSLLQALCDIACTAACQRVKNGSEQFKVWVPSLADVTLVLMNMGAAFVTLYPSENLQPLFTEGDLLENVLIESESPSKKAQTTFSEHNSNNVLKYLSHGLALCPHAYSDDELLLLLTVVGRISLDTRLILQSAGNPSLLHYQVIKNFQEWSTMLPRICEAFADLTDDHHNMCYLIHLLPNNKRGKQLRQHLSLAMISKLLDGRCTYRPTQDDFQLSNLRPFLRRMRPSNLLRRLLDPSSNTHKEEKVTLDQQAYYLCYSLLTLLNEASNVWSFSSHQKEQLQFLLAELEVNVKCDIRENEKSLYRSKVKDLVARIDTKWQMMIQKTKPLNGKLYNSFQPVETLISEEEQEDGELTLVKDESETTVTEENDVTAEVEEETVEPEEGMEVEECSIMKENSAANDGSKTEGAIEPAPNSLYQATPDGESNAQHASTSGYTTERW